MCHAGIANITLLYFSGRRAVSYPFGQKLAKTKFSRVSVDFGNFVGNRKESKIPSKVVLFSISA
jgi:hypothetical protein